jgi:hypothetical protein
MAVNEDPFSSSLLCLLKSLVPSEAIPYSLLANLEVGLLECLFGNLCYWLGGFCVRKDCSLR